MKTLTGLGATASSPTAASSLLAGNVFLATVNPQTLMTIGTGVGSAVMGSTGIVAQAPFVAASTALIPVVAPVMLFMTVSSVITGARLDRVQQALGALSKNLERVRHLMEAEDYARLESATEQLDEIGSQFEHGQRFTEGMKIELVVAKRDLTVLRRKFGHLAMRRFALSTTPGRPWLKRRLGPKGSISARSHDPKKTREWNGPSREGVATALAIDRFVTASFAVLGLGGGSVSLAFSISQDALAASERRSWLEA